MDESKLLNSDFWNKKIDRLVRIHDTNKNGHISRQDFMLLRERLTQQKVSKKFLAEFIKSQDMALESVGLTDDSVKYTYDQFKKVLSKSVVTAGEKYKDIIRKSFKTLDLNENGFISFEEWTASYTVIGVDTKYARASFDVMDKNVDGQISEDEMVNFYYEFYCTAENVLGSSILYGPL